MTRIIGASMLTASLLSTALAAQTLDIFFIDVEGGQSTLIVTPAGESLLIDTGYAGNNGRDPRRILAAAQSAGIRRIDYLPITHFHGDHDGGAPELSRLIRSSEGFATLHQAVAAQGVEDVWQVDKSSNRGAKNFPDERIANLDGTTSHWIKIRAGEDGTFTVINGRTGQTKTYQQN